MKYLKFFFRSILRLFKSKNKTLYTYLLIRLFKIILLKKFFGINGLIKYIERRNFKFNIKLLNNHISNYTVLTKSYYLCHYFGIESCLIKSCLAFKSFHQDGASIIFYIGVIKKRNLFSSHSWIEINGVKHHEDQMHIDSLKKIYKFQL